MSQEFISSDRGVASGTVPCDRELLEMAAKAAGLDLVWPEAHSCSPHFRQHRISGTQFLTMPRFWDPLTDDGDALRLAVKLGISVNQIRGREQASCISPVDVRGAYVEPYEGDQFAASRRAIVRAAARLGADTEGAK
jgi:hypothetical protein